MKTDRMSARNGPVGLAFRSIYDVRDASADYALDVDKRALLILAQRLDAMQGAS